MIYIISSAMDMHSLDSLIGNFNEVLKKFLFILIKTCEKLLYVEDYAQSVDYIPYCS